MNPTTWHAVGYIFLSHKLKDVAAVGLHARDFDPFDIRWPRTWPSQNDLTQNLAWPFWPGHKGQDTTAYNNVWKGKINNPKQCPSVLVLSKISRLRTSPPFTSTMIRVPVCYFRLHAGDFDGLKDEKMEVESLVMFFEYQLSAWNCPESSVFRESAPPHCPHVHLSGSFIFTWCRTGSRLLTAKYPWLLRPVVLVSFYPPPYPRMPPFFLTFYAVSLLPTFPWYVTPFYLKALRADPYDRFLLLSSTPCPFSLCSCGGDTSLEAKDTVFSARYTGLAVGPTSCRWCMCPGIILKQFYHCTLHIIVVSTIYLLYHGHCND